MWMQQTQYYNNATGSQLTALACALVMKCFGSIWKLNATNKGSGKWAHCTYLYK